MKLREFDPAIPGPLANIKSSALELRTQAPQQSGGLLVSRQPRLLLGRGLTLELEEGFLVLEPPIAHGAD